MCENEINLPKFVEDFKTIIKLIYWGVWREGECSHMLARIRSLFTGGRWGGSTVQICVNKLLKKFLSATFSGSRMKVFCKGCPLSAIMSPCRHVSATGRNTRKSSKTINDFTYQSPEKITLSAIVFYNLLNFKFVQFIFTHPVCHKIHSI